MKIKYKVGFINYNAKNVENYYQTGRSFKTKYKGHIHDIKHNKEMSKYARHILHMQHAHKRKKES
jgi:hypothetical protein